MNNDLILNPNHGGPRRKNPKKPLLLGLTGSIGMGKTTIGQMFQAQGLKIWASDQAVHSLYRRSLSLKQKLMREFGIGLVDQEIDRKALIAVIQSRKDRFETLNQIVHPLVMNSRKRFIKRFQSESVLVADIPLLFELGLESQLDAVLVVSCPFEIQKQRVLQRPNMSEDKFQSLLSRQMPDTEKRKKADYIIETHFALDANRKSVATLIDMLLAKADKL